MNEAKLREIEERARAATPGPWRWWTSNSFRRLSSDATGKDGDVAHAFTHPVDRHPDISIREADQAFIAHARGDVPALVAEVRRLQAEVQARDESLRIALTPETLDAATASARIAQALAALAQVPERHELAKRAMEGLDALKTIGGRMRSDAVRLALGGSR